jgi:hypothetical protein
MSEGRENPRVEPGADRANRGDHAARPSLDLAEYQTRAQDRKAKLSQALEILGGFQGCEEWGQAESDVFSLIALVREEQARRLLAEKNQRERET